MCFDSFLIAVAGLRFYGGNLALHHEFDVGTIITGTGWVHSADLTGVDTFHCQSWGFNSLVRKSICMTLPQIHSKYPT